MKNQFSIKSTGKDLFIPAFFIALLFLLVFITSSGKGGGLDIWWHIQLGENIFKTGDIAANDTFSFTAYDKPQRNQEWLADLIIYLSYKLGGFNGLYFLKSFLLSLMAFFLFFHLSGSADPDKSKYLYYSALLTVALIVIALQFRTFLVRPLLFSFTFVSLFLFILGKSMEKKSLGLLLLLPIVQLLWTNMSVGAVIFGPLIFAGYVLTMFFKKTHKLKSLILVASLILIATLINPDGPRIYKNMLYNGLNPIVTQHDQGSYEMGKFVDENKPLLEVIPEIRERNLIPVLVIVAIAIFQVLFFKGFKQIHRVVIMAIVLLASFKQYRLLGFCVLISAEAISDFFNTLISAFAKFNFFRKYFVLNGIIIASMFYFIFIEFNKKDSIGLEKGNFTFYVDDAINFIRKTGLDRMDGNMFNGYDMGGYLIRHLPEKKVFIDGRINALYDEGVFNEYMDMLNKPEKWDVGAKRWDISFALLAYDIEKLKIVGDSLLKYPAHLENNPEWALIYWDGISMIYVKRDMVSPESLEKFEYRFVQPSLSHYKRINKLKKEKSDYSAELYMIDRDIALNDKNQEPRLAKVMLLLDDNTDKSNKEILYQLGKCIPVSPDLAFEYNLFAQTLIKFGRFDEARPYVERALELNPESALAKSLVKKINDNR